MQLFAFDYVVRQKVGGTHLNFYLVKQLPVIPPHTYTPALLDFITPRVLELTYTAWDLQPFARDLGYEGAPFVWDDQRRFLMRCELDALYFHLYGIERADVDYIMETFPIVKRKDEAAHGEYRTKRVILEFYDQMATLAGHERPRAQAGAGRDRRAGCGALEHAAAAAARVPLSESSARCNERPGIEASRRRARTGANANSRPACAIIRLALLNDLELETDT